MVTVRGKLSQAAPSYRISPGQELSCGHVRLTQCFVDFDSISLGQVEENDTVVSIPLKSTKSRLKPSRVTFEAETKPLSRASTRRLKPPAPQPPLQPPLRVLSRAKSSPNLLLGLTNVVWFQVTHSLNLMTQLRSSKQIKFCFSAQVWFSPSLRGSKLLQTRAFKGILIR